MLIESQIVRGGPESMICDIIVNSLEANPGPIFSEGVTWKLEALSEHTLGIK